MFQKLPCKPQQFVWVNRKLSSLLLWTLAKLHFKMANVSCLQRLIPYLRLSTLIKLTLQRPSNFTAIQLPLLSEQANVRKTLSSVILFATCHVNTELYQPSANSIQNWASCQMSFKAALKKLSTVFQAWCHRKRLFWKATVFCFLIDKICVLLHNCFQSFA